MKKKNIGLIVMGCGGVGRQLLHHITACRSLHSNQGICLRVLGVCDSKSLLLASDDFTSELDDNFLLEICRLKSNGSSLQACRAFGDCKVFSYPESMSKLIDIAAFLGQSTGLAFIDCSASSETIEIISQVVNLGCCAVLANKKPLTCSMEEFDKLFSQPRRIRHESTVGAGLPVIASLNRMLSSGDPINCIIGSWVVQKLENLYLYTGICNEPD